MPSRSTHKEKMKLGIIGLPQSGKTTIFNALTRGNTPTTASAGRFEVHTSVVDVPDERIDKLTVMFKPRKTIYAKVTYADIAGLEGSSDEAAKSGLSGQLLNQLQQMDGFVHVVRCFENASVPHPSGSVDPRRDIASLNYLITSHLWQQDQNGFTHQDPGFLDHVINKKASIVRVYLPPDANCLLSVFYHCLRSKNYVFFFKTLRSNVNDTTYLLRFPKFVTHSYQISGCVKTLWSINPFNFFSQYT